MTPHDNIIRLRDILCQNAIKKTKVPKQSSSINFHLTDIMYYLIKKKNIYLSLNIFRLLYLDYS